MNYIAQKSLINRFIINSINFHNVKIYTVDKFQGKKLSIMIFNIVDNDCFDFL